jgi:hypothetical protein
MQDLNKMTVRALQRRHLIIVTQTGYAKITDLGRIELSKKDSAT